MGRIFTIFWHELKGYFYSLTAYVVISAFLIGIGFFFFFFGDNVLRIGEADMNLFFFEAPIALLVLTPLITMRSFAEEYQRGTIELLGTRPLNDWQILIGKYLAAYALIVITLIPSVIYYLTLNNLAFPAGTVDGGEMVIKESTKIFSLSRMDNGPIIGAYIGLLGLGSLFVGIGLLASTLSNNVIVAFLFAFAANIFFFIGFHEISRVPMLGWIGKFGIWDHYTSIWDGVVDSRDIIYFLSFNTILIVLSKIVITSRR